MSAKIVDFSEIRKARNPFNTDRVERLDAYLNKTIIIEDFKTEEGVLQGRKVHFTYILATDAETSEKVTLRTTSEVVLKQLAQIEPYLKEGMLVKTRVLRKKRYLCLG